MQQAHEAQKQIKAGEIEKGKYESTRGVLPWHVGASAQEILKHPIDSIKGIKHKETVE